MIREDGMSLQTPSPLETLDYSHGHVNGSPPVRGGDILASGFGMTVAAWIAAYISRIPMWPSPAPGQLTISLMLGMVLVGGFLAARYSAKGIGCALGAGAVSGLLDILVVGSVLHDAAKGNAVAPVAALWVGGSVLLNTLVAGVGGLIGMWMPSPNRSGVRWNAVFAAILACATLPLITAGGLVTAFGVGMAVPDWPQSYGYNMFLFPLSQMQSVHGNFYEHAHRLMGSLVGLTSLAVAIYVSVAERRGLVIGFAWAVFVSVCVQAVMGGLRVTENSIPLATLHGIFAQVVFAAMACLAAAGMRSPAQGELKAASGGFFSGALLVSLVVQLTLGALVRQRIDSLVLMHIIMAAGVTLLAITCGFRALVLPESPKPLKRTGIAIMVVVGVQLLLGIMALIFRAPPLPAETRTTVGAIWTTAHQANGALLLASSALLWFWDLRLMKSQRHEQMTLTKSAVPVV
jgi:cytochrome c oxidase assembly protein subunit 15